MNGGVSRLVSSARRKWKTISTKGVLKMIPTTPGCILDSFDKDVLRCILREDHVQFLSWQTRRLRQKGEEKLFSYSIRKVSKETIWKIYVREVLNESGQEMSDIRQGLV